jgi:mono/diheme cytochrome c family protein
MNAFSLTLVLLGSALCLASTGCRDAPGKPKLTTVAARPDQVLDFPTLYKQNCAACHGIDGKNGAAIALANPVYLMTAGADNLKRITAAGLPGTLMPPFAATSGGTLTDTQVTALTNGMVKIWGDPESLHGVTPLGYASHTAGVPQQGKIAFATFCATCHGADGEGVKNSASQTGSIVDATYLALVSDQSLRSIILAGRPDLGMPDWRSDVTGTNARALTDQQVTDIVAWIGSHRVNQQQQTFAKQP